MKFLFAILLATSQLDPASFVMKLKADPCNTLEQSGIQLSTDVRKQATELSNYCSSNGDIDIHGVTREKSFIAWAVSRDSRSEKAIEFSLSSKTENPSFYAKSVDLPLAIAKAFVAIAGTGRGYEEIVGGPSTQRDARILRNLVEAMGARQRLQSTGIVNSEAYQVRGMGVTVVLRSVGDHGDLKHMRFTLTLEIGRVDGIPKVIGFDLAEG